LKGSPLLILYMEYNSWVPIFPEQASTFAWQVDLLYFYLILVSVAFTIPIVAAIFFFAIKYREREKFAATEGLHGSIVLETTWSIIPFVVSMTIFLGGAYVYYNQYTPPDDAMEIYVVGKQWMWKIQHETGQREINELHIPVKRKIKLTMTTEDVLHDFFIPAFRTKADIVPGRYTYLWFEATKPGKYHLFCAEYCGLNHSGMGGWVYVMDQRDYDNWLSGNASGQTPVELGKDLFENKARLRIVPCRRAATARCQIRRNLRQGGQARRRRNRHCRRSVYKEFDSESGFADRRRLYADNAYIQRPGNR